jgi:hypothetical protein
MPFLCSLSSLPCNVELGVESAQLLPQLFERDESSSRSHFGSKRSHFGSKRSSFGSNTFLLVTDIFHLHPLTSAA